MDTTILQDRERPLGRIVRVGLRAASTIGWLVVIVGALLLIVPAVMGMDRYVITGNSMAPEFHRGSVVFSEPVPIDDLQVGDIITYLPPASTNVTQYVTHRIVSVERGDDGRPVLVTQGDNNDTADPWEFQLGADVQNVVRYDVPAIGHLLAFMSNPSNRIVLLGVPAGLIAIRALIDLVRALAAHPDAEVPADHVSAEGHIDRMISGVGVVDLTEPFPRDHATDGATLETDPPHIIELREAEPASKQDDGVLVR